MRVRGNMNGKKNIRQRRDKNGRNKQKKIENNIL
jgi:hypothetical protein